MWLLNPDKHAIEQIVFFLKDMIMYMHWHVHCIGAKNILAVYVINIQKMGDRVIPHNHDALSELVNVQRF